MKIFRNSLYFLLLFKLWSCTSQTAPEDNNPLDPDNPEFEEPKATLIPPSPAEGDTINQTSVEFKWEGIESNSTFEYKLQEVDSDLITTSEFSIEYSYLDDKEYTFQVEEIFETGHDNPDSITYRDFTINAVQNGVILYPYKYNVNDEEIFGLEILVDELNSIPMGFNLVIQFDGSIFNVQNIDDSGYFGVNEDKIFVSQVNECENITGYSCLEINLVNLNLLQEIELSGKLIDLTFSVIQDSLSGTKSISFTNQCAIKDTNNDEMTDVEWRGSIIDFN